MELFNFSWEIKRDRLWRDDWWVSDGQNSFGICDYVEKIVAFCCSTTGKKGRRQQESARHHALIVRPTSHVSANQLSDKQFRLRAAWKKKDNRFEGLVVWRTSEVQWFKATSQYVKMFFTVLLKGDVLESRRFVELRTLFLLDCIDLTVIVIWKIAWKQETHIWFGLNIRQNRFYSVNIWDSGGYWIFTLK